MSVVRLLVGQKRLILTTSILLALYGMFSWSGMNRQEVLCWFSILVQTSIKLSDRF